MTGWLEGLVERTDNVLGRIKFAEPVRPLLQVFTESLACDGHIVAVDELVLEEVCENFCSSGALNSVC